MLLVEVLVVLLVVPLTETIIVKLVMAASSREVCAELETADLVFGVS